ncbi:hypothetical protein RSAG8_09504, partial [Rhizoctonia solani AG-8 WAC10335]
MALPRPDTFRPDHYQTNNPSTKLALNLRPCLKQRISRRNTSFKPPALTPASPTKTRPSIATKTTLTITSASTPGARTLPHANSSTVRTARFVPTIGFLALMSKGRTALSPVPSNLECSPCPFVTNPIAIQGR